MAATTSPRASTDRGPGSVCRLYYDVGPELEPADGDLVRSSGGSWYLILDVRRSKTRPERYHLRVRRLGRDVTPGPDTPVWPLHWYRRPRR